MPISRKELRLINVIPMRLKKKANIFLILLGALFFGGLVYVANWVVWDYYRPARTNANNPYLYEDIEKEAKETLDHNKRVTAQKAAANEKMKSVAASEEPKTTTPEFPEK
jgi:hypothetical protein